MSDDQDFTDTGEQQSESGYDVFDGIGNQLGLPSDELEELGGSK